MPYGYGQAQKDYQKSMSQSKATKTQPSSPNRNPDLMTKSQKKDYAKTTTVGKIHPALNYTLAGTLINAATMPKTSTTTEHKGLRQDLRTGAYYHKAPAKRPTKSGGNGGGVTTVAQSSGGSTGSTEKLAGIDGATKLGFTHTNPAKTSFSESEGVPLIGSPTKPKRA
jgi:hypothetical protein